MADDTGRPPNHTRERVEAMLEARLQCSKLEEDLKLMRERRYVEPPTDEEMEKMCADEDRELVRKAIAWKKELESGRSVTDETNAFLARIRRNRESAPPTQTNAGSDMLTPQTSSSLSNCENAEKRQGSQDVSSDPGRAERVSRKDLLDTRELLDSPLPLNGPVQAKGQADHTSGATLVGQDMESLSVSASRTDLRGQGLPGAILTAQGTRRVQRSRSLPAPAGHSSRSLGTIGTTESRFGSPSQLGGHGGEAASEDD